MIKHWLAATAIVLALAPSARRGAQPPRAALITVTTFTDELNADGDCSLREAINAANLNMAVDACASGGGDDVIALAAGTYSLSIAGSDNTNAGGDLDIAPSIATERLSLQGAGAGVSFIDGGDLDRVLHVVTMLGGLRLADLTVQNGLVAEAGGAGVLNWGLLELEDVVIRNNTITGTGSDAIGGGLCIGCITGTGQATLTNTTIENNNAQRGGGLFSNRPLTISASSILTNTALSGGGISNYGALMLVNSTVSGNTGSNNSGAISHNSGVLSIRNSTISHNASPQVGGISGGGDSELINTILAANGANCSGSIGSQGHNLSDDASCAESFTAAGDRNGAAASLGPLSNNGGPTLTRALLPGSPAINGGANEGCPAADQRGIARPQAAACDIGAYEYAGFTDVLFLPMVLSGAP